MENYANNSDAARKQRAEAKQKKDAVIEPGRARVRKRTDGKQSMKDFFAESLKNAAKDTWKTIIVPALKKTASEAVNSAVNIVLYKDARGPGRTVNARTPYSSFSAREPVRARGNQNRRAVAYEDILFDRIDDAEVVLRKMAECIEDCGTVSISEMYEFAGCPNDNWTFGKWGWTTLRSAYVSSTRDGYIIDLPNPVNFN